MSSYNEVLVDLKNTLQKDNIECNENQISLYDLYDLVNAEYEDLRKINKSQKHLKKEGVFSKNSPSYLRFEYCKNSTSIYIRFNGSLMDSAIFIKKENDSKDFFIERFSISTEKANKFIKKNYDKIIQLFSILEKYSTELYEFESNINKYSVKYNNYEFNIYINSFGNVDLNIKLKDDIDSKDMYNRQYYQKDTLMQILKDSRFELAKKIKIDVNTLDSSIVDVISKSKKSDSKKLVK